MQLYDIKGLTGNMVTNSMSGAAAMQIYSKYNFSACRREQSYLTGLPDKQTTP